MQLFVFALYFINGIFVCACLTVAFWNDKRESVHNCFHSFASDLRTALKSRSDGPASFWQEGCELSVVSSSVVSDEWNQQWVRWACSLGRVCGLLNKTEIQLKSLCIIYLSFCRRGFHLATCDIDVEPVFLTARSWRTRALIAPRSAASAKNENFCCCVGCGQFFFLVEFNVHISDPAVGVWKIWLHVTAFPLHACFRNY